MHRPTLQGEAQVKRNVPFDYAVAGAVILVVAVSFLGGYFMRALFG